MLFCILELYHWYWNTFLNVIIMRIFFLLMTHYLLYVFSTRELMLDKKQIWIIFLFKFTTSCKAVETAHIIINAFGPEPADEGTVQWWYKELCKGNQSLENKGCSGWPLKVDKTNWEHHQSWSFYNYTRCCWRTQCQPFYSHSKFEANWKSEKPW